jgi:glycine cleavage system H protein
MNGCASRVTLLLSASPNMPRPSWATWCFVELPEPETMVAEGDEVCVIESVKAASDILAPVDGEIVAVNEKLVDNPGLVNEDPTGAAWFFKMKLDDLWCLDGLMDEDEYQDLIG